MLRPTLDNDMFCVDEYDDMELSVGDDNLAIIQIIRSKECSNKLLHHIWKQIQGLEKDYRDHKINRASFGPYYYELNRDMMMHMAQRLKNA